MSFYKWKEYLDESIELFPLELAGRGRRVSEELAGDFQSAVADIADQIIAQNDGRPYMIFGHSIGCWIAYELYFELVNRGVRLPEILYFSGNIAPYDDIPRTEFHRLDQDGFVEMIMGLGGTSGLLFEDKEIMNHFIPVMRNDFKIVEQYSCDGSKGKIEIPIAAIAGKYDPEVSMGELLQWKKCAGSTCSFHVIEGGHFYPYENLEDTLQIINEYAKQLLVYA